jgi:hypothetical protein
MRFRTFLMVLVLAAGLLPAQDENCTKLAQQWPQLLREYKFADMEALVEQAMKQCTMETNNEIYHEAALTYLWRGKPDLAKPIVEKISSRAGQMVQYSPGAAAFGASNYLPFIAAAYGKDKRKVEDFLADYENSNFKSQEQALIYLLRTNDKRLINYYIMRRATKRENSPLLCQVYCKRNSLVKECPCMNDPYPAPQGGPYAIYQDYVKGKPLPEIRKELDARYSGAPGLKKEIQECLGIQ